MSVHLLRILLLQKGFNRIIARVVQTSGLCSPVCCFQQLPIVVSTKDYDQDKDLVIHPGMAFVLLCLVILYEF